MLHTKFSPTEAPSLSALACFATLALCNQSLSAQSNGLPGLDLCLSKLEQVASTDRLGTFPSGLNSFTISTLACNIGSQPVPWFAAMGEEHPLVAFLVAREDGQRLVQISDYSSVKHCYTPTGNSACAPCGGVGGSANALGLNCSTLESAQSNADNYWLGPADEIDPWLGDWVGICSRFDSGSPAVAAPKDCDGVRSLTNAQAVALLPVGNRVKINDVELLAPGNFFAQANYVVIGELESARGNNSSTRGFSASWNGSKFVLADSNQASVSGTLLDRWPGATVSSATNGADDGRVFVAVKVTGPVAGQYHYEYAIYNRDNARGLSSFRLPICHKTKVSNLGFRDIDSDSSNDWSATQTANELRFETSTNPLRWNSIYNVWFDSDAAPESNAVVLDAFLPGVGANSLSIVTSAPSFLPNVYLGPGCSFSVVPNLYVTGKPPQGTLGNTTFALESAGNLPTTGGVLVFSAEPASNDLGSGCTQWFGGPTGLNYLVLKNASADPTGLLRYKLPVPADLSLEGVNAFFQSVAYTPQGGPLLGFNNMSSGLMVRLGNQISGCP